MNRSLIFALLLCVSVVFTTDAAIK